MTFIGPILRSDLEAMRSVMGEILSHGASCFLIADLQDCTGIDASARKYMAEWSKDGGQQITGTAVYGVNFAMRTIVTLTLSAIKFLGHQQVEVVFVKDEADAQRYVAERRAALA